MRDNHSQGTGGLARQALADNRCCEAEEIGCPPLGRSRSWEGDGVAGVGGRTFQKAGNGDGFIEVAGTMHIGEGEEGQYRLVERWGEWKRGEGPGGMMGRGGVSATPLHGSMRNYLGPDK